MSVNSSIRLDVLVASLVALTMISESYFAIVVHGYPTASVNLFSHQNKLEDKLSGEASAEHSFQQFIHSKPDSTIIGELKPNSSELDILLLKNKIASTILSMQEMEKAASGRAIEQAGASDCFIEVTRVERVAGKCHKVNNGLPICQSENYMAINTDCS